MKQLVFLLSVVLVCFSLEMYAQDFEWAKSAGGSSYDYGNSITTDAAGNVYATGAFQSSTIAFGAMTLTNNGGADIFIVKYDPSGNIVWAKSAGGSSSDGGYSITTDAAGNVYATGEFYSSTIAFGATTLTNNSPNGSSDIFIVKYDPNGNVVWAKSAGGSSSDGGYLITTDAAGNVYATGYFSSSTIAFGATTLTNNGYSDIFIVKYDPSGNIVWAKSAGGSSSDYGYSITTDAAGNVYATGNFGSPTIAFGATTLTNKTTTGTDIFIVKYDPSGNIVWAKSAGGSSSDGGYSITTDAAGNVYATGGFQSSTIAFGATTLTNNGVGDIFITKIKQSAPSPRITWQSAVTVKENAAALQALTFGYSPNATDGIDTSLGEISLPPLPPLGAFNARFILPGGTKASIKDYRNDTLKTAIWNIKFQPDTVGVQGYPIVLTWDQASLPDGSFTLQDNVSGTLINVNMKTANSATISNSAIAGLQIVYKKQICKDISLLAGWNLFGVPLNASDMTIAANFPSAKSPVYAYNNGYSITASVAPGKGYWINYPTAMVNVCGSPVNLVTIPLSAGWNIVSVYENDIPVSAVTTTPAGIISSFFFGFDKNYIIPTVLQSGKGYWVEASATGVLNLPVGMAKSTTVTSIPVIDTKWSSIQLSDAAGNKSSIYFSASGQDISKFALPPVPPAGIFDVRFASQSFVENLGDASKTISISGAKYPVEIRAEGIDLLVKDAVTGKLINAVVKSGSSIAIADENITSIEVSSIGKPVAYELQQNYPNPFNPATMIRFGLPENTRVRLTIFNQIGEQVAELVNGQMESGYHQVTWNAGNMSSGVYFYELKTDKFKSVKKLILMK